MQKMVSKRLHRAQKIALILLVAGPSFYACGESHVETAGGEHAASAAGLRRRRQQDADAALAAAPAWVETSGFECHPNTRWSLKPTLTNGKAAWTTSWSGREWQLYHRPGHNHYWVIDSADDDSSAPAGKQDIGGPEVRWDGAPIGTACSSDSTSCAEDGGPVPRSSSVTDDLHTPWTENCDDPVMGDQGHWQSNHRVTVRAPLSGANCDAIAAQAAGMSGCEALHGGGGNVSSTCTGCEHPWVAMAVRHPIMWRDAAQCSWAAVCAEEALQRWARAFPDVPALRRIRDAQAPSPGGCLTDWVDFSDPCPTWGDNALLGGWAGVVCNGTRVVGLGLSHEPGDPWPAELQLPLLDTFGDRSHVELRYNNSGRLGKCVSSLPKESIAEMHELRYISLEQTSVAELPQTICELTALATLELPLSSSLRAIPDCLCNSGVVKSLSPSSEVLQSQPGCLPRSVTRLSIQRQNLRVVPALVSDLFELTDLDLRNNLLTNLTDLSKLQKLTVLKLTNNQLESLPSSMFELSELQHLWVDVNKLTSLPPAIGKLTQLLYLKLDDNHIGRLPDEIGQLQSLQTLQADAAGLRSLPPTINNCLGLTDLYLDNNRLTGFPDISSLVNLRLIRASNNSISVLEDSFVEGLTNIAVLELRGNDLSAIPTSVGHLPNLQNLDVSENRLVDLPILYYAHELLYLHIGHNRIKQFGQQKLWRSLTSLQELHINHNELGPSLPDDIENSAQLRMVIANDNRLTSLPDSMGSLVELVELQVQNNALTALPAWTGTLPKLKVVDATNNSISQVPAVADSIGHLYLYQNPINATSQTAEQMLASAQSLTTFDISASSASQYIWDTVPGFNICGRQNQLRDGDGRLVCVPRVVKSRYCHIDRDCQFTVAFMDEYGLRSRIGGLTNITLMPLDWTSVRSDAANRSVWPLLLTDDRNGAYTGVISAHEMLTKGTHRFQLFKDGYEFWAPQTTDGVYTCDEDDTPPYPHCPLDINFEARHCGDGSHPDEINGTTCECDSVGGVLLERVSDDVCVKHCDSETSVPSADHHRCDCKEGHYDTSKVGLVVCLEDSFDLQRTKRARKRQSDAPDHQCLPCPPCLDCSMNASTAPELIGVPVVKARHRMNFSAHRMLNESSCPQRNGCEQYVYDCLGETEKSHDGSDVRNEVCPAFQLNDPNISCSRSHTGPLCNACAEKHILDSGGKCKPCGSARDLWWLLIVSLAFVGVVPIFFGVAQTMKLDEKLYEWLQNKLAKYGKSENEVDVKAAARFAKDIRHLGHFFETTKITISFGQVVALLPGVLGVPEFNMISFKLPGFGLDLRGTLQCFISEVEKSAEDKTGQITPSQVYFDAWLLHVIGLPMLMFIPVALFMLYQALQHRFASRDIRDGGGRKEEIGAKLRAHAFFCIFLLYPSQVEAIFRVFECRSLGCHDVAHTGVCPETPVHCDSCDASAGECDDCPERWLEDDMRVSCNGSVYHKYKRVAQVFVIVIALGFPMLVWMTLHRTHKRERQEEFLAEYDHEYEEASADSRDGSASPTSSIRGSVISRDEQMVKNAYTAHYRQQYYFWEPLDMIRKLTLTGLISLLGKGTVSQLFVAILVAFFFFCVHIACAPCRQPEDNLLKGCADLELFFVMLVTLVKKLGEEDHQVADENEVPDAFIGDLVKPKHYDAMIVVSFAVNVVAAYIFVVLYKLAHIGRVVRFRKARSWRKSAKEATEQLLSSSSNFGLELELATHDSARTSANGQFDQQISLTTTLPSPSPRTRGKGAGRDVASQRRSAKLDEVLGLSPRQA